MSSSRTIRHRRQRRGTAYLAVLGTAMFVTLLGLSGVMAVRLQRRIASTTEDATQATYLAQSAVELALQKAWEDGWQVDDDGDWTEEKPLGRGTLAYRFMRDGSGGSDGPLVPLRIEGRSEVGEAVRVVGVRLTPSADGSALVIVPGSWRQIVD